MATISVYFCVLKQIDEKLQLERCMPYERILE